MHHIAFFFLLFFPGKYHIKLYNSPKLAVSSRWYDLGTYFTQMYQGTLLEILQHLKQFWHAMHMYTTNQCRILDTLGKYSIISFTRKTTFGTFYMYLPSWTRNPFWKRFYSKSKEFAPGKTTFVTFYMYLPSCIWNPFWKRVYSKSKEFSTFFRIDSFSEGEQYNFDSCLLWKCIYSPKP